jgi:hypothetical protein
MSRLEWRSDFGRTGPPEVGRRWNTSGTTSRAAEMGCGRVHEGCPAAAGGRRARRRPRAVMVGHFQREGSSHPYKEDGDAGYAPTAAGQPSTGYHSSTVLSSPEPEQYFIDSRRGCLQCEAPTAWRRSSPAAMGRAPTGTGIALGRGELLLSRRDPVRARSVSPRLNSGVRARQRPKATE